MKQTKHLDMSEIGMSNTASKDFILSGSITATKDKNKGKLLIHPQDDFLEKSDKSVRDSLDQNPENEFNRKLQQIEITNLMSDVSTSLPPK